MSQSKGSFYEKALRFFPQVKQEVNKVVWPSRRETTMTTAVVFIFVLIAACFFLLVDQAVYRFLTWVLGFNYL